MRPFILFLIATIIVIQSCKKGNDFLTIPKTIDVTIKVNEDYQFDLGIFGDEEGASINGQANHYSISAIERDFNTGKTVYEYKPLLNYTGIDQVELKSERGSDGASPNNEITFSIIKFTIIN